MRDRDIVEEIKKFAPASLKVTLTDGTEKPVAVPKAGNRWARLSQVLESLRWATIECLDKDGRLLVQLEAEEVEQEEGGFDDGGDSNIALAHILKDVMRSTMKETRQMFEAQLRGNADLVAAMTEGMRSVAECYRTALQVQSTHLLTAPAAAAENDSAEMMRMMQLAMSMMAQQKVGQ